MRSNNGKASMKKLIITTILKMCGEAVLLAILAGIIIGIIGKLNGWNTSHQYSNAFFIAGCLLIIGGAFSRQAAGQDWDSFQLLSAESFRDKSPGERANIIINASSSVRLIILGLLSGALLILTSVLIW
jgi:hypothetical protein